MTESNNGELYCYRHPDRETRLRCNSCDKPICVECAVQTPTGYRCKECVRGQQKIFNTAQVSDYIFGAIVAAILAYLGAYVTQLIGFFIFFIFLISPAIGVGIAEVVRRVIKRRRSKRLFQVIAGAAALGGLVKLIPSLLALIFFGSFDLFGLIWTGVYVVLMVSSLYYRLSGIRIGR